MLNVTRLSPNPSFIPTHPLIRPRFVVLLCPGRSLHVTGDGRSREPGAVLGRAALDGRRSGASHGRTARGRDFGNGGW